jgi:hypothetical protein
LQLLKKGIIELIKNKGRERNVRDENRILIEGFENKNPKLRNDLNENCIFEISARSQV